MTARKDSKRSKSDSKALDLRNRLPQMPMTTNFKYHQKKAISLMTSVQMDLSMHQVNHRIFPKTQRWHLFQESIYSCLKRRTDSIWEKRKHDLSSPKGLLHSRGMFCALCSLRTWPVLATYPWTRLTSAWQLQLAMQQFTTQTSLSPNSWRKSSSTGATWDLAKPSVLSLLS